MELFTPSDFAVMVNIPESLKKLQVWTNTKSAQKINFKNFLFIQILTYDINGNYLLKALFLQIVEEGKHGKVAKVFYLSTNDAFA